MKATIETPQIKGLLFADNVEAFMENAHRVPISGTIDLIFHKTYWTRPTEPVPMKFLMLGLMEHA